MNQKIIPIIFLVISLTISSAFSQTAKTTKYSVFVPRDTSKTMWNIGAGAGVPYGTFGGKFSLGTELITGDIGFGFLPFAWTPAFSFSGALHFGDRYANIRPKITLSYSNVAAAILILREGRFDPLYDETFTGVGIYAGFDWRLSKTSPLCLDLNVGWIFPSAGNNEVEKKYNEVVNDIKSQGFITTYEKLNLDTPKISIGISYAPARSLK